MRYGRYGLPYVFLRWGLGLTFIFIGVDIFRNPQNWIGYMPTDVPFGLAREGALRTAGFFDVALGALFIARFMPKTVGFLASMHLIVIIVMNGLDSVVVRDIGLLGATMAIWFWPTRHHRRRLTPKFMRKKKKVIEED